MCLVLAACGSMPKHYNTRGTDTPEISIMNAPEGSTLLLDGQNIGAVTAERHIIPVAKGSHDISIMNAGSVIYERTIFIENGTRKEIDLSTIPTK
ncbi:MAG: hypothetical protein CMF31_01995 [Kordiimonas sp.]|nr:hypothetical protein [Kordiimonas sp.]|tara:strand:+ start:293 stop:577 length:285 start_codon:yes stop_codon:yes gene_type:complete